MFRYEWAKRGDINAFFGLMLDNVAVMIVLTTLIAGTGPEQYTQQFVLTQMIPGTALGVLVGDLAFTWMAFSLARRTKNAAVTAMPLGLDTPSTFAVGPLVLVPAIREGVRTLGLPHDQAMVFGWHVGAMVLLLCGIAKTCIAPFGSAVRRWIPRAGLLGSLAAIALALIAFVPLWTDIAVSPLVGMGALVVILWSLVAHRELPGKIPGALAAVLLGVALHFIGIGLTQGTGVPIVSGHGPSTEAPAWQLPNLFPAFAQTAEWWERVFVHAVNYMPLMLPFALATVVGGIDCTESAAAAGDEYDTRAVLVVEGIASILAGLAGGVIQTTPYIGHPAYKTMGGRAGYTLATALFIGVAGLLGWFVMLFDWLPQAAMFPILVFVGLEITSQSFHATPVKHYPAIALAIMPALAYLILVGLDVLFYGNYEARDVGKLTALRCLANGFIITSLLWAAALAAFIDGLPKRAAIWFLTAAGCTLVGVIHSPLKDAALAWPWEVVARMPAGSEFQTPYHWAGAYLIAAGLSAGFAFLTPTKESRDDAVAPTKEPVSTDAIKATVDGEAPMQAE